MIVVDGLEYDVRIKYNSLVRSFSLIEGPNKGTTLSYKTLRDVKGTGYSYEMQIEPNPNKPDDYDALYEVLSQPVDSHEITVPYGQSTITFDAYVTGGQDTFKGHVGGYNRWTGMKVQFIYIQPQRNS